MRTREQLLSDAQWALRCSLRDLASDRLAVAETEAHLAIVQRRAERSQERIQAAKARIKELKELDNASRTCDT